MSSLSGDINPDKDDNTKILRISPHDQFHDVQIQYDASVLLLKRFDTLCALLEHRQKVRASST